MAFCDICPRVCGADREKGPGLCGADGCVLLSRAAPHMWEEPCISGERGSGAVFFCGCPLKCVYCQNREISRGGRGFAVSVERLAEIFGALEAKGCHNLNMVTPTHYTPQILAALELARPKIPVVWNTGGYERVETLKTLNGRVQVYMPDFKYMSPALAGRYSAAPDYPEAAKAALGEMVSQRGRARLDENGLLVSGVLVRHLVLPGQAEDSKRVIEYLYNVYGDDIFISVMSQYTPPRGLRGYPELERAVTEEEYAEVVDFACEMGVTRGFTQDGEAVSESFIPPFDGEGVV